MSSKFPVGFPVRAAKIIQCPRATNTAIREQNEAVTNTLGIHQLMNRKDEGTALGGFIAQHSGHLADLSEVEAINGSSMRSSGCGVSNQAPTSAFGRSPSTANARACEELASNPPIRLLPRPRRRIFDRRSQTTIEPE